MQNLFFDPQIPPLTLILFFHVLDIFDKLRYELYVNSYLGHFKSVYMDATRPASFFRNRNKRKKIRKNKTVYFQERSE